MRKDTNGCDERLRGLSPKCGRGVKCLPLLTTLLLVTVICGCDDSGKSRNNRRPQDSHTPTAAATPTAASMPTSALTTASTVTTRQNVSPVAPNRRSSRNLFALPTNVWTDEEKEANQRLFLEKYRNELSAAIAEIRRQIEHHTQEKIKNEKLERMERRKLAIADDFIKKAKLAAKEKKFPVVINGQTLSQKDLETLFLKYSRLIRERRPVADEYAALKNIAEQQLHKLNAQLPEKLAQLDKSAIYIKRLDAKEHIGRINEVIARIEDSGISAQLISDSFTSTFVREEKKVESIKVGEEKTLESLYE